MVAQTLVQARRLTHLMVAFCDVGCIASCVGIEPRRELEVAVLLVEVRGDCVAPRDVRGDLGKCRQPGGRAVGLSALGLVLGLWPPGVIGG